MSRKEIECPCGKCPRIGYRVYLDMDDNVGYFEEMNELETLLLIEIEYCPFCGRKLSELNEVNDND